MGSEMCIRDRRVVMKTGDRDVTGEGVVDVVVVVVVVVVDVVVFIVVVV